MNVDWKPHSGEGAHVSGLAFILKSHDFCFILASKPSLLRSSWNRKDFHHPSCCQRTLWVTDLFFCCFFLNSLQYRNVLCSVVLILNSFLLCLPSGQSCIDRGCWSWMLRMNEESRSSGRKWRTSLSSLWLGCVQSESELLQNFISVLVSLYQALTWIWRVCYFVCVSITNGMKVFPYILKRLKPMTFPRAMIFCLQRKAMSSF